MSEKAQYPRLNKHGHFSINKNINPYDSESTCYRESDTSVLWGAAVIVVVCSFFMGGFFFFLDYKQ